MKPIDELVFTDDYMFGAVLRDPKLCKGVLERLLGIKIEKIEYPELQKAIQIGYEVHGIRLDVYVKDSDRIYDLEMQNAPNEDIGKRTRFYQSIIDADHLLKGQHYSELVESKVIFICKTDPFNAGLQCYTFENICIQNSTVLLNDKTQKLIYNAEGYKTEKDDKLRAFMNFVSTNNATDDFTKQIQHTVELIKKNEQFRSEYLKMYIGLEDEKRRAVKEAVTVAVKEAVENAEKEARENSEKKTNDIINNLLKIGKLSNEEIANTVNVPVEKVDELAKNQNN